MKTNAINKWVIRLFFILFFTFAWWVMSNYISSIPSPAKVFFDIIYLLPRGILNEILLSGIRVIIAIMISFFVGTCLGLLSVKIKFLNILFNSTIIPLIEALPPLTWTIICVLIIGMGEITVIFVLSIILIQFYMVCTLQCYRNIDKNLSEMLRSFRLGQKIEKIKFFAKIKIFFRIDLGFLIPYLITATRLAYGVAWKVLIIAEMFGASRGIGYLINQAYSTLSITRLISLSILVVIFFLIGDHLVLRRLEKKQWRKTESL